MVIKKITLEMIGGQVIPNCGYYCSLLPLASSPAFEVDAWNEIVEPFPEPNDTLLQQNVKGQIAHHSHIMAKHHAFAQDGEVRILHCSCVDTLLERCISTWTDSTPSNGDIMIYSTDDRSWMIFPTQHVKDHNSFQWIFDHDKWVSSVDMYYHNAGTYHWLYSHIFLDKILFFQTVPIHLWSNIHDQHFVLRPLLDKCQVLNEMNILLIDNTKYLSLQHGDFCLLSKPLTNKWMRRTMGLWKIHPQDKQHLLQNAYMKTETWMHDVQFLIDFQLFVDNDEQNVFLHRSEACKNTIAFVKDVDSHVDSLLYSFSSHGDSVPDVVYPMEWLPIAKAKHITRREATSSRYTVHVDAQGQTIQLCEEIKCDFRACFRDFYRAVMDENHVWQVVQRNSKLCLQSTAYLQPLWN